VPARARAGLVIVLAATTALASCPSPTHRSPPAASRSFSIDAHTKVVIHVPPDVMALDDAEGSPPGRAELERRRVRESVRDLERVLREASGAEVVVATEDPPARKDDDGYRILVGPYAERAYGPVRISAPFGQGFRVLVHDHSAALYGETGLATSYAIYELLHRIGCRWFLPGPLGEVLPPRGRIILPNIDERRAPSTDYRGVWYADDAWKRRNREGGLSINAGHALELRYVTKEDRERHPEWVATIHGKPDPRRLRWSSPTLAAHVADRIVDLHRNSDAPSFSVSPDDGTDFDDSPEDRALDSGDFDPTLNRPSITDRYLTLVNRIAEGVSVSAPEVLLGFLAYVQYTRPPIRERVHPNLVPQIAPITYARAHPMSDDRVPGNRDLRSTIAKWGELAPRGTSIYFFGYFLAEPSAPNPMLTKWGHDVPFVLANNARYWQPETFPNFETSMHALYMGMRVAFDSRLAPQDVYDDIDARFYGAAGPAMHAYWKEVDRIWIETPEYSGGVFGQARRFTPERLARLHELLESAKRAARIDIERRRIELADDSLSLFDEMMRVRRDFIEGRFEGLASRGAAYRKHAAMLGEKWKESFAFTQMTWAPDTVYAHYYDLFQKSGLAAMTRVAETQSIVSVERKLAYRVERGQGDPAVIVAGLDAADWKTTDVGLESWSSLGLHDWFGAVWYRTSLRASAGGKRRFLWLSSVDGAVRVFVNGKEARYAPDGGAPATPVSGGGPLRFELTGLAGDGESTVSIYAKREALNELGVGGLMGPVVLCSDR
jgi:hypothetical protein